MADYPTRADVAKQVLRDFFSHFETDDAQCKNWADCIAADLQAEWVKARTIETREQLDALPDRAVVLADNREVWSKNSGYYPGQPWWAAGSEIESPSTDIALPARLLHHPGDSQ